MFSLCKQLKVSIVKHFCFYLHEKWRIKFVLNWHKRNKKLYLFHSVTRLKVTYNQSCPEFWSKVTEIGYFLTATFTSGKENMSLRHMDIVIVGSYDGYHDVCAWPIFQGSTPGVLNIL